MSPNPEINKESEFVTEAALEKFLSEQTATILSAVDEHLARFRTEINHKLEKTEQKSEEQYGEIMARLDAVLKAIENRKS